MGDGNGEKLQDWGIFWIGQYGGVDKNDIKFYNRGGFVALCWNCFFGIQRLPVVAKTVYRYQDPTDSTALSPTYPHLSSAQ